MRNSTFGTMLLELQKKERKSITIRRRDNASKEMAEAVIMQDEEKRKTEILSPNTLELLNVDFLETIKPDVEEFEVKKDYQFYYPGGNLTMILSKLESNQSRKMTGSRWLKRKVT